MKNEEKKRRHRKRAILVILIITVLAAAHIVKVRMQFREIEANAVNIYESAGLSDVTAKIVRTEKIGKYRLYCLDVEANGADEIGYAKVKSVIKSVQELAKESESTLEDVTLEHVTLITMLTFDGRRSWEIANLKEDASSPSSKRDSSGTSSHISGNPYEGMSEERINSTDLGTADEVVNCRDFSALRADRRYKTYNWYDSSGRKKATATVRYENGEGYVSSFSLLEYNAAAVKEAKRKLSESKKSSKTDSYNTRDYRDPDDFYEDHYDDFDDYDDAEDYYYDNCD